MDDDGLIGGRYRRVALVGAGGMGEVWLGEDTLLERRVAVKRILAQAVADPEAHVRLLREARLSARLDHPHAVTMYDVIEADGVPHLIMQFVDGRTLAELVAGGTYDPRAAAGLLAGVADALAQAHELGIVHRDIKPSNVLVDGRGRALLADFGIARAATDSRLTAKGDFFGTPGYLAAEVAQGDDASPASDVYALGATIWAAVEGRAPHDDGNSDAIVLLSRALTRPVPHPVHAGPLTELLLAMLDLDPRARPAAAEVARALAAVAAELPPRVPAEAPTMRAQDLPTRRRQVVPVPLQPVDALDTVLAALEHTDRATYGWSGPLAEWENLVVNVIEPMLADGDRADLMVPALFGLHPRRTGSWPRTLARTLTVARAGMIVALGDRLLCAWTKNERTLAGAGITIAYRDVRGIAPHVLDDHGVHRTAVRLVGDTWEWPFAVVDRPELRPLADLLTGRISGVVQPVWTGDEVSAWHATGPDGRVTTLPGWVA